MSNTCIDNYDAYLQSDVPLLVDVFESFRKMTIATYKLDPATSFTAPGLSWDAMLKLTGVELQLVDDPGMYLMVEWGILDGVCMITKKHAVADSFLVEDFDASKSTNYSMYLDANNLYGWAMSQKLPERICSGCKSSSLKTSMSIAYLMMRRLAASLQSTLNILLLSTTFTVIFQCRQSLKQFKLKTCLLTASSYMELYTSKVLHI